MEAVKEAEAAPAVEEPTPAAEEPTKPIKEKKPKAPREKKPKQPKTASHPPYFQMIKEAILALNEKSGSSPYAIAKYMEEKHKTVLPGNFKKILGLQLKKSAAGGKLIKIKASYKLSSAGKKGGEETTTTTTATTTSPNTNPNPKPVTRRRTKSVNKVEAPKKKTSTGSGTKRKMSAKKPKQPKSIKSPAAKRSKKA